MNGLKIFESEEFGEIRTLVIDGEPWFVGVEIAKALGYSKPHNALAMHVEDDDSLKQGVLDSKGRMQETIVINESGLYSLALSSKLPSAKAFKRWITKIVIPSIRKHGGYIMPWKLEDIFHNPENLKLFLGKMLELSEENTILESRVKFLEPKAKYFEQMIDSGLSVNLRNTAKELGLKPSDLVGFLLSNKYLYRNKNNILIPYQKYMDKGLFELKEFIVENGFSGVQTLITPVGRMYILQLFLNGEIA